jgi:hypothetical protein
MKTQTQTQSKLTQHFSTSELMTMHTGIEILIERYQSKKLSKKTIDKMVRLRKKIETAWEYPEMMEQMDYNTMGII